MADVAGLEFRAVAAPPPPLSSPAAAGQRAAGKGEGGDQRGDPRHRAANLADGTAGRPRAGRDPTARRARDARPARPPRTRARRCGRRGDRRRARARGPGRALVEVAAEDERRAHPTSRAPGAAPARRRRCSGSSFGTVAWTFTTHTPAVEPHPVSPAPLGPAAQPGRGVASIAAPRTRIALDAAAVGADEVGPALGDPTAHGQQAVARGEDVALVARRRPARAAAATTAAPPGAARRPRTSPPASPRTLEQGASAARDRPGRGRGSRSARAGSCARMLSRLPRHFLTGAELSARRPRTRCSTARWSSRRRRTPRAPSTDATSRCCSRSRRRARGCRSRPASSSSAGHPMILRSDELQLSRDESPRDTALVLSRHVHAVGVRTGDDALVEELAEHASIPVFNMLTADHHPCQALADLLTLRETFGRARRAAPRLRRRRQQRRALAGACSARSPAWRSRVAAPDGYQLEPEAGADAASTIRWRPSPGPTPSTRTSGSRWATRATADARRAALAPYRLDDALLDRAGARRDRPALPSRAPGRGDHRRGALRPAPAHLGPGREPPPRAEGSAGVAGRMRTQAPWPPVGFGARTTSGRPALPCSSTARIAT